MNVKRTATIVVVGGAFAAWLSAAIAPLHPARAVSAVATPQPIDARGADLAKEIVRLQNRLRPDATPAMPGRNLFEFRKLPAVPVTTRTVEAPVVAPQVPAIAPVALSLAGIAEDDGANGTIRTAIISGSGQVYLVKQGDDVPPHYKVVAISADTVELQDINDGTVRRLALK